MADDEQAGAVVREAEVQPTGPRPSDLVEVRILHPIERASGRLERGIMTMQRSEAEAWAGI